MAPEELADILDRMYRCASRDDQVMMVHLFGIRYADEIGKSASEIVRLSELPDRYDTQVRRGVRLARYVSLRPDWDSRI